MISKTIVSLVAFLHLNFLVLEMFLWTKPLGLRVFRNSQEKAKATKVMATNQGLYNGFLATGLIWGLLHPDATFGRQVQLFFLACILVAGIFAAFTVNKRIFLIQGLPAFLGILTIYL